jgi:hypothetical protein
MMQNAASDARSADASSKKPAEAPRCHVQVEVSRVASFFSPQADGRTVGSVRLQRFPDERQHAARISSEGKRSTVCDLVSLQQEPFLGLPADPGLRWQHAVLCPSPIRF